MNVKAAGWPWGLWGSKDGGYSRSFRGSLKGRRGAEGGKLVAPRPGGAKGLEEGKCSGQEKAELTPGVGGGAGAVGRRQGGQEALLLGGGGLRMGDGGLIGLQAWGGGEERGEK